MPLNKLMSEPINALTDAYRNAVNMRKRVYGESLLKSFTGRTNAPISESDFTSGELSNLDNLVKQHYQQKIAYFTRPKTELLQDAAQLEKNAQYYSEQLKTLSPDKTDMVERAQDNVRLALTQAQQLKEAAQGKLPSDFAFGYSGYGERTGKNKFTNDPAGWAQTLGRFRYKVDPSTGAYQVYDSYDFNNDVHKYAAEKYANMSPPARMGNALADTFLGGDQYALGEAYLSGKNVVPLSIKGQIK
jgi:hypothetical protein